MDKRRYFVRRDPLAPDDLFLGECLAAFYQFTEPLIREGLKRDGILLDVGCGDGRLTRRLLETVPLKAVTGVDIREGAIELATRGGVAEHERFLVGDGQDMDWIRGLGAFDCILARTSLHHFVDPIGSLKAYAEMLPSGGRLVLVDLDRESAWFPIFGLPLTLLITWCKVLRTLGWKQGVMCIRGMQYPSHAWRRHRAVDVAHRRKIGWYRYRDIAEKLRGAFPGAKIGRIGSFAGLGGVHYMLYERA